MATVTPNFNWPVPTSTDLVKDGATAIEALGDSIDGSLVDLKGGTTGQVLSKTSGTDMDFTWVTTDDANAIQNSIVNAKGDLIGASANDTPAILSVGANGETLVADSSTSTGLRYQGNFAAGKNKIINGDMSISQRGTSFSNPADATYNLDRWKVVYDGTGATTTVSQQTFTPGTSPTGYSATSFWRWNVSVTGSGNSYRALQTEIENVQTFAGQTVTLSFFAKADSARTLSDTYLSQRFGSGGSAQVNTLLTLNSTSLTTSWQRFTATVTLPSISGKTIGASSSLQFTQYLPSGTTMTIDIWGVQVEAGSTATAFQTATGTIQGELAACQRYYIRWSGDDKMIASGAYYQTTDAFFALPFPVEMRTVPTGAISSTTAIKVFNANAVLQSTNTSISQLQNKCARLLAQTSARTNGDGAFCQFWDANAWIEVSAEL